MTNGMDEWQAEINQRMGGPADPDSPAALRAEIERLRAAVDWVIENYPSSALTHMDFRVEAYIKCCATRDDQQTPPGKVPTRICPNCNDANSCGDYQGATCDVCGGLGRVATGETP